MFSQKCVSLDPTVKSFERGQCITPRHLFHCLNENAEITIFRGKNNPVLTIVKLGL